MTPRVRVGIDARLVDGQYGGVQQVVLGMAHGLSRLIDGDEEYVFLAWDDAHDWLLPHLGPNCFVLSAGQAPAARPGGSRWRASLSGLSPARFVWDRIAPMRDRRAGAPRSDGTIENAGIDVMHFTIQSAFLTAVPSIYHPHDLQHVHLPHLFTRRERLLREDRYRTFCEQAAMVAVTSSWVKRDLVSHFDVEPEKIEVIPWAPPTEAYGAPTDTEIAATVKALALPDAFVFYPAQTWPHKNHLALVRALARLRERDGLSIHLVGSGKVTEYASEILAEADALGVRDFVRLVGFVTELQLQALYGLATAVVIPTRFEAASYPVWEAFQAGTPVACSTVTSLPEQVGDAALTFSPDSSDEIADAIRRLWTDASLRETLAERGRANVSRFTLDRTARHFRAHYRRIAGRELSPADQALIDAEPLL